MNVKVDGGMWLEDLIEIAEQEASCELWGVLKREDEKYVTERAYENPKFVEDLVRDVAARGPGCRWPRSQPTCTDSRVQVASCVLPSSRSQTSSRSTCTSQPPPVSSSAYARIDVDKDA